MTQNNKDTETKNVVGFVVLITIVLIMLKLFNVVNWNWWLILSPMLISFSILLLTVFIVLGMFVAKKGWKD